MHHQLVMRPHSQLNKALLDRMLAHAGTYMLSSNTLLTYLDDASVHVVYK
jgi:hypothetical protein